MEAAVGQLHLRFDTHGGGDVPAGDADLFDEQPE